MNAKLSIPYAALVITLILSGFGVAVAEAAPSPSLRISHVSCIGCGSDANIEVHFVLVNIDKEIADYGGVSYTMAIPGGGTIEGMAGFSGHTGNAIHYTQHISGGDGTYTLLSGSVTLTGADGSTRTYNLDNAGETYTITGCEPCVEPTPDPTPEPPEPDPDPSPPDPRPEPPPQRPPDPLDPFDPPPDDPPADPIDPGEVPGDDPGDDPPDDGIVSTPVAVAQVPPAQPQAPAPAAVTAPVLLPETGANDGSMVFGLGLVAAGMMMATAGLFIARKARRRA